MLGVVHQVHPLHLPVIGVCPPAGQAAWAPFCGTDRVHLCSVWLVNITSVLSALYIIDRSQLIIENSMSLFTNGKEQEDKGESVPLLILN